MSPRPLARPHALLAFLVVATLLLAGCHGLPHDNPGRRADAASVDEAIGQAYDDFKKPGVTGTNQLPLVALSSTLEGGLLTLHVTLAGDVDAIATHRLAFGDGTTPVHGGGAPAARYTHTYPEPPTFRDDDYEFTVTLTLLSERGHTRVATEVITIAAPANRAPIATLSALDASGPMPLRPTFKIGGSDPDGTIQSWRIDFGDGTQPLLGPGAPDYELVHEYRIVGTHTATLTVIDDRGKEGVKTMAVQVWNPVDLRVWTIDSSAFTVTFADANGTALETTRLRSPSCGRGTTCETPVDLAASATRTYVLLDRAQADGMVNVYDARTGTLRASHIIHHAPDRVWIDTIGGAWITYRTSGIITHFSPLGARTDHETDLGDDNGKFATFSADGTSAWFVGTGEPAQAAHFDFGTQTMDTLALPLLFTPVALAHQDTYNQAIVAGQNGLVVYLDSFGLVPTVQSILDLKLDPGAQVVGLACSGRDTCWVAVRRGDDQGGALLGIPARADPGALLDFSATSRTLPDGLAPTSLYAGDNALVIGIGGPAGAGLLQADPATGLVTSKKVDSAGGPGALRFARLSALSNLVYADAPDLPGWRLLDTASGRIVHESLQDASIDGLALARLARR